ncbi:MAG: iron ABC transporter permease [Nitrospirae bacterium]|nr:MAG: iron ABC transporter permease [Nitrospirota bacterium]
MIAAKPRKPDLAASMTTRVGRSSEETVYGAGSSPRLHESSNRVTMTRGRWSRCLALSCGLALLTFWICVSFGTESIALSEIVDIVTQGIRGQLHQVTDPHAVIVWQVRVPRVLLACLVGGSLAMVGAALQALLRNPLADPFVIGISSGAALGAAVALLFGLGVSFLQVSLLPACAFLGALLSLTLVYRMAVTYGTFSIHTMLLAGVVLNAIFSALIMFLTSVADPDRAYGMYAWLMGTLTGPAFHTLAILAAFLLIGFIVLTTQGRSLNVLTLGEEVARSLGVEVERVKRVVFLASALLTGTVVAFSGLIGFVGLIVPHAVRLLIGAEHRLVLIISGVAGGIFLMIADTVARTVISPAEIPVGVVTALVGGPIFLYLLINRRAAL